MKKRIMTLLAVTGLSFSLVLGGCMRTSEDPSHTSTSEQSEEDFVSDQREGNPAQTDDAAKENTKGELTDQDPSADSAKEELAEEDTTLADRNVSDENEDKSSSDKSSSDKSGSDESGSDLLDTSENLTGLHHIEIEIANYGTISAELDADTAPITVTNFIKLSQQGFYDGLTFHRIINGFMMQGGDPLGNGTGGSRENIKGEFSNNGVENPLSHTRGALSMARAAAPDSASSQFFIVQTDCHYLDGDYAVFGYVTDGIDVVDEVCKLAKPTDNNGTIKKEDQPVIKEIRVID